MDNGVNIYKAFGITNANRAMEWIRCHAAIVTITLSILMEQFFWCPVLYGTFEIPVSTLLNGGSFSTARKEVGSKLNELLWSNAKIWTLANVAIYNAPVDWRVAIANFVNVIWQIIVSDVAADCGKAEDDTQIESKEGERYYAV